MINNILLSKIIFLFFSFLFLSFIHLQLLIAIFFTILLLTPSFYLIRKIDILSIRILFYFSFTFILIGLINFYSYPELYYHQNLKEFFFKGTEVIEVIIPIALFFFGLTVFSIILKKFFINNPINKKIF